ncbi:hypothetical protein BU15DRAFT_68557 [Melanogaster broomeanus]|nr:hypothetical protein BU15DRAFT_68557 [Melanogaster broomeanus]
MAYGFWYGSNRNCMMRKVLFLARRRSKTYAFNEAIWEYELECQAEEGDSEGLPAGEAGGRSDSEEQYDEDGDAALAIYNPMYPYFILLTAHGIATLLLVMRSVILKAANFINPLYYIALQAGDKMTGLHGPEFDRFLNVNVSTMVWVANRGQNTLGADRGNE